MSRAHGLASLEPAPLEVILRADLREVFPLAHLFEQLRKPGKNKPFHAYKEYPLWRTASSPLDVSDGRMYPGAVHWQGPGSGAIVLGSQAGPLPLWTSVK